MVETISDEEEENADDEIEEDEENYSNNMVNINIVEIISGNDSVDNIPELIASEEHVKVCDNESKVKELKRCKNKILELDEGIMRLDQDMEAEQIEKDLFQISLDESNGIYKIDGNTPVFKSGSKEDVEVWLYKMETALEFENVPKGLWLVAVGNYVEGKAFELVMSAKKLYLLKFNKVVINFNFCLIF